jgi:hypothetical protein
MDIFDKKIQSIIKNLETEKQNNFSPFLPKQIDDIIIFLNFILKNISIGEKNLVYIFDEIKKINYWATDSWPFENKIVIELMEIIETYEKLIKHNTNKNIF